MSDTTMDRGRPAAAVVREWARKSGLTVSDKGKVPMSLYEAYTVAHSTSTNTITNETAVTITGPSAVVPPPPGWYPDTTGVPALRWWDGSAWTEHRRDHSASPVSAIPAQRGPHASQHAPTIPAGRDDAASQWGAAAAVIAGAILAVIGALLPWISVETPFGSLSRSGVSWDSSDATIIIVLAVLAGLTAIGKAAGWEVPMWLRWSGFAVGAIDLMVAIYAGHQVSVRNNAAQELSAAVSAHVGAGIYLCGAAGVIIAVGSAAMARSRSPLSGRRDAL